MSDALEKYRAAEEELFAIRERHGGKDSEEEDVHLDKMDILWDNLIRYRLGVADVTLSEKE